MKRKYNDLATNKIGKLVIEGRTNNTILTFEKLTAIEIKLLKIIGSNVPDAIFKEIEPQDLQEEVLQDIKKDLE